MTIRASYVANRASLLRTLIHTFLFVSKRTHNREKDKNKVFIIVRYGECEVFNNVHAVYILGVESYKPTIYGLFEVGIPFAIRICRWVIKQCVKA